ncbi:hypothetical protein LPY66_06150 [Dehalobacter sp. DCM]|uniref:hypothetical protein n=1 Tax=Dehalobacter sp. DCM TaxID=2907827 RepID=UPI00308191D8|nr:hypothetical protein LPY66_06150 [Dehalobacter sp. DCM]
MEQALKAERIQNILDTTNFIEPKKVPVGIEFITWPFAYAGVTYREVMHDPKRAAECYVKFLDNIELDWVWGAPGVPFPIESFHSLGIKSYEIAIDDTCIQHQQVYTQYMEAEEYDNYIKDPKGFQKNVFIRRTASAFSLPRDEAYAALKDAAQKYKPLRDMNNLIRETVFNQKQIVSLTGPGSPMYYAPFDTLFDHMRGIKNALTDIRRRPDKVKEACDAIWAQTKPLINPDNYKDKPFLFGRTFYHSACFISPKQFDELIFSYFLDGYGELIENGLKFYLKGEGQFLKLLDRYRQFPKGSMVIMLDEDDPFEAYKIIGDWQTVATGIRTDLMQYGTKQQCVDYVKKCFDTFAPGGGFMFTLNKPLIAANDVKIDNLIAVYQTANELSRK